MYCNQTDDTSDDEIDDDEEWESSDYETDEEEEVIGDIDGKTFYYSLFYLDC